MCGAANACSFQGLATRPRTKRLRVSTSHAVSAARELYVVSGTEDKVVDPRWLKAWCERQGVRFLSIEGGGHNLGTYGGAEREKAILLHEMRALAAMASPSADRANAKQETWRPREDEWLEGVEEGYVFKGKH